MISFPVSLDLSNLHLQNIKTNRYKCKCKIQHTKYNFYFIFKIFSFFPSSPKVDIASSVVQNRKMGIFFWDFARFRKFNLLQIFFNAFGSLHQHERAVRRGGLKTWTDQSFFVSENILLKKCEFFKDEFGLQHNTDVISLFCLPWL